MRIRTVKPEWLEDERMSLASPNARVMSIALMLLADDDGRGRANPSLLAGRVFPGSSAPREDSSNALRELATIRFVVLYESDGQSYYAIRNWKRHQKIDKARKSQLPAPPTDNISESLDSSKGREDSSNVRRNVDEDSSEDLDHYLDQNHDHDLPRQVVTVVESDPGDPTAITPRRETNRGKQVITAEQVLRAFERKWTDETGLIENARGRGGRVWDKAQAIADLAMRSCPDAPLQAVQASAFGYAIRCKRDGRWPDKPFDAWAAMKSISEHFVTDAEVARA